MDYVIRRRNKGMIKPFKINCNRGITTLEDEESMEPLSPSSAVFHKPDFNIHVLAIMGIKSRINVDVLKARFPSTLLKHPRFSSVVVTSFYSSCLIYYILALYLSNYLYDLA